MQELFRAAVERGASDIHLKAGDVVRARIHGDLQPLTQKKLSAKQVKDIALSLIPHEEDRENFDKILDYDCSWGIPGIGRFRVNILKQRGSPMIVLRSIPIEIPSVEDLGLPPMINKIANNERGMVLVTGVTGSGKSSTMAAMINWIMSCFTTNHFSNSSDCWRPIWPLRPRVLVRSEKLYRRG